MQNFRHNNLYYSYCKLDIVVGIWQDCIVLYYIDQFHIHFELVRIIDLWNVNYICIYVTNVECEKCKHLNQKSWKKETTAETWAWIEGYYLYYGSQTEWQHKMALNLSNLLTSGDFLWIHNEGSSAIKGREIPWPMSVSVLVRDCWVKTVWALYICAVMIWALHVCAVIVSILFGHSHSHVIEHSSFLGCYEVPLGMQFPVFDGL
jgi:ssDNA-binding Zn-finger/Zn-ribbon topoisomerase 1